MTALLLTLAAFNIAVGGYYTFAAIRYRRAMSRVRVLGVLLTDICARAYIMRHAPIWDAWMQSLGSYEVQVKPIRREWAEEGE